MAIKTISGHSRAHMNQNNPHPDFPHPGDMRSGTTWAIQMARIPAASRPPLAAALINQIASNAAPQRNARRILQVRYRQRTQNTGFGPSARERAWAAQRIRSAEWELANRYSAFDAIDGNGIVQSLIPVTTMKDSDNSLWHALSYQINGPGIRAGDPAQLGLRGGRREKAWLYHYFTEVLHNPGHIRHRLYSRLQADSRSVLQPGHNLQTTAQMADWGELSMLRCLAVNDPDGGVPKWPQFEGIFQLIADFWRQEVVVFVGPKGLPGVAPLGGWRTVYTVRVFGKRAYGRDQTYGNPLTEHGQLLFVTDSTWQHFDAVEYHGPGHIFDTSHIDENERYNNFRMPFLEVPGFIPPVSRAPTDIPATNNGLPPNAPGFVSYGRPADDPVFCLLDNHPLVLCYEHDHNAIETRPGFGDGNMPRLANMLTMGSWLTELGPPGVDVRPTVFEDWSILSGCYKTLANPLLTCQGRYANNKAKLVDEYSVDFDRDRPVVRPQTVR